MQSNYINSFEKVSKKNTRQDQKTREFNQGNPHRQKRRAKRKARYEN